MVHTPDPSILSDSTNHVTAIHTLKPNKNDVKRSGNTVRRYKDGRQQRGWGLSETNTYNAGPALGAGAADNRNWDDFEDVIYTAGDQGDDLPAIGSFVSYGAAFVKACGKNTYTHDSLHGTWMMNCHSSTNVGCHARSAEGLS